MSFPSVDTWLKQAKQSPEASLCGMYLTHNGVVRQTPKAQVRQGVSGLADVVQLELSCDAARLQEAVEQARGFVGVHYVRAWVNTGVLSVGSSMMFVLVGADIRPHCVSALERLVETIKTEIVVEREIFAVDEGAVEAVADGDDDGDRAAGIEAVAFGGDDDGAAGIEAVADGGDGGDGAAGIEVIASGDDASSAM